MKGLLIPLGLLALGTGGGVGAGLLLAPPPAAEEEASARPPSERPVAAEAATAGAHPGGGDDDAGPYDYVRLNNQFVVPVIEGGAVAALVLLSLSVETGAGQEEAVLALEPKLRDLFLQVLFDHANPGGFEGVFTAASAMQGLRRALLAAAREEVGGLVTDVLVTDLVRQDA